MREAFESYECGGDNSDVDAEFGVRELVDGRLTRARGRPEIMVIAIQA